MLKYFLAVVETGSFTGAANRVFVTQPTLSAGIKKLESEVGQPLFERTNRRVFLTDAGTRFLPHAKAVLHECNMAMQALDETATSPVLRLGVLTTISSNRVACLLSSFREKHPSVTIEIYDGTEQELTNRLEDRSLEYALSIHRGEDTETAARLGAEGYHFILSQSHSLAGKKTVSARDLMDTYMIVRSRCEVLSETSRYFTDKNIRPRLVYRTPNDNRAISMVAAGIGGTVVPTSLITEQVSALQLQGFDYTREVALFKPQYNLPDSLLEAASLFEHHVTANWAEISRAS